MLEAKFGEDPLGNIEERLTLEHRDSICWIYFFACY